MSDILAAAAQDCLRYYDETLGPVFDEVRDAVGPLAVSGMQLEDLRVIEANRTANQNLITSCMTVLPSMEPGRERRDSGVIKAADVYTAKQVIANTLWRKYDVPGLSSSSSPVTVYEPRYIIGSRPGAEVTRWRQPAMPTQELLLLHKEGNGMQVEIVRMFESEAEEATKIRRAELFTDYSSQEITRMFDRATGMLRIDHMTPGGVQFRKGYLDGSKPHKAQDAEKLIRRDGLQADRIFSEFTFSDEQMQDFGVLHHLSQLAVAFGRTEELRGLLTAYGEQRQTLATEDTVEQSQA